MRTLAGSFIPVALALAACGTGEMPTVPSEDAGAGAPVVVQQARATRPLAGRCVTTFNPPSLPPPPVHHQIDIGTCQLTHLGRTALQGEIDIDFANGTQRGTRTLTAANGDQLYLTSAGTSVRVGPRVHFEATLTIVGGTGRFAGATGEASIRGQADLLTNTTVFEIEEGWVGY
jgi:hypothetical protein